MTNTLMKVVVAVSLCANIALAYKLVDNSVTITHQGEALAQKGGQLKTLASLAMTASPTRSTLERLAAEKQWQAIPKESGIWINEVWFETQGDIVKTISFD